MDRMPGSYNPTGTFVPGCEQTRAKRYCLCTSCDQNLEVNAAPLKPLTCNCRGFHLVAFAAFVFPDVDDKVYLAVGG